MVLLKVNKAINENAISPASKKPDQIDTRKLQSLLLLKNALLAQGKRPYRYNTACCPIA